MNVPKKLSFDEAKTKIVEIVGDGNIVPTDHAEERMEERDVTIDDIRKVLLDGTVESAEMDDRHNNWKYSVRGTDIEEQDLTVVTVIIERNHRLRIITVYGEDL